MEGYEIREIKYNDTKDFILNKHYAQRMPSISFAYGLFNGDYMVGVLTIGKPASNSLCRGVCGPDNAHKVYELNRLITEDNLPKNTLSFFRWRCFEEVEGRRFSHCVLCRYRRWSQWLYLSSHKLHLHR